MINIDNKYSIGDIVFVITDKEQEARIVTALIISKSEIVYELYCGITCSKHYDFELSYDKNNALSLI